VIGPVKFPILLLKVFQSVEERYPEVELVASATVIVGDPMVALAQLANVRMAEPTSVRAPSPISETLAEDPVILALTVFAGISTSIELVTEESDKVALNCIIIF
jgi:hypothetical protein